MLHCKTSSLSDLQRGVYVLGVCPTRHFSAFKAYRCVYRSLPFSIFNKNRLALHTVLQLASAYL